MAEKIEDRLFEIISGMFTACPVVLEEPSIVAAARIVRWGDQLIAVLQDSDCPTTFFRRREKKCGRTRPPH